jgi:3-oxoacyl-[acyl-carrier protein] reductase
MMHNSKNEELVRVNTLSPILLTKYISRAMMSDGAGRIVNIAPIVAFTGYSDLSVYAATKSSNCWLHPFARVRGWFTRN